MSIVAAPWGFRPAETARLEACLDKLLPHLRADATLVCSRCELSADARFPLAARRRIYDLLGYT